MKKLILIFSLLVMNNFGNAQLSVMPYLGFEFSEIEIAPGIISLNNEPQVVGILGLALNYKIDDKFIISIGTDYSKWEWRGEANAMLSLQPDGLRYNKREFHLRMEYSFVKNLYFGLAYSHGVLHEHWFTGRGENELVDLLPLENTTSDYVGLLMSYDYKNFILSLAYNKSVSFKNSSYPDYYSLNSLEFTLGYSLPIFFKK